MPDKPKEETTEGEGVDEGVNVVEKETIEFDADGNVVEDVDTSYIEEISETPPEKRDILWAMNTPINEMSLDDQMEAIKRIREMRKVRISATKKKSELDFLLAQLSPEKASSLLKQLEAMQASAEKDKDSTKTS
jgi:hypothetical protein